MSERSRKLLIALAALMVGVTSACNSPSPQAGEAKPAPDGPSGIHPFAPKDTPIIIADDGTSGLLKKNAASGIYLQDVGGHNWTGNASTNYVFTLTLVTSTWLIADGMYEDLDNTTSTSFDIGKQTVSFNLNASPPTVTVTPKNAAKDVCNIDSSDPTQLHCNGKIHGNNASVGGKKNKHSSASDDGSHDYFLFVPQ